MKSRKLWQIVALFAFALLPLAGCSGGGDSPVKVGQKGTEVTVSGKVEAKSTGKTVFLSATSAGATGVTGDGRRVTCCGPPA